MKRVLLIQGDNRERSAAAAYLSQHGWQVYEAASYESGMALAVRHRPLAVVCDLPLPESGGLQFCSGIHLEPRLCHTRVLAICEKDFLARQRNLKEIGADDVAEKPVPPPALLTLLERLTGKPGPGDARSPAGDSTATVKFWGVRGSIPSPGPGTVQTGGNTSCVEVRAEGEHVILDAGSGIRPLGLALAAEFKTSPLRLTILISHSHWDHIQGFPFFLPAYDRKNQIHVVGCEGAREGLTRMLSLQMEAPFFPISLSEMPGNIVIEELKERNFSIGRIKVQALPMNHPGICMGYRLSTAAGVIAYLPDNEPCYLLHPQIRKELAGQAGSASLGKLQEQRTIEFVRQADVLVLDAQYDSEEYRSHVGWGHGNLDDVVKLAVQAQVKRLFLFHHDPEHPDAKIDQMIRHARELAAAQGSPILIDAAREGDQVDLRAAQA